ncbi:SPOR domain-containing protein [Cognatiluteimonas profundi]|uniref:SPOR domain-containing protein n=1 Tax=Cognatiluteimonas profundi TaxID=2594501 RepID=UPI00131E7E35|nr:SPOR domain-containing protein [Lysobacter profundi]
MAAKRGKSQARRNSGRDGGLPGWAWLVLGVLLTIAVVMAAPRLLKSGGGDGFFRPKPNPDAQPAATRGSDDAIAPDDDADAPAAIAGKPADKAKPTQYDFYTMLPGNEVVMSDAELAATAREESARQASAQKNASAQAPAATVATTPTAANTGSTTPNQAPASTPSPSVAATSGNDAPYLLQAGAFGASGDAEATKAKVALLGLGARVESATINGKTVYRVRMGPYGTASELAEAKRKLANGGLPAMAIKVK